MPKITLTKWEEIRSYMDFGSQMARAHDAAFVLIATAEIEGETTPRASWLTSGLDENFSPDRSEATIALLEHAASELRAAHKQKFGYEARKRGYKTK